VPSSSIFGVKASQESLGKREAVLSGMHRAVARVLSWSGLPNGYVRYDDSRVSHNLLTGMNWINK